MRTVETIKNWLEDLDDNDLMSVWNEYCQNINDYDNEIFTNDEYFFNDMFEKPYDIVLKIAYGSYDYNDNFIKFDGYGNFETFNYVSDVADFDEMAEHIFENESDYSYLDGLDDYDEEDEEDEEESEEDETNETN